MVICKWEHLQRRTTSKAGLLSSQDHSTWHFLCSGHKQIIPHPSGKQCFQQTVLELLKAHLPEFHHITEQDISKKLRI